MKAVRVSDVIRERCMLVNYLPPNQNIERDILEAMVQRVCQEPMSTNTIIAYLRSGRAHAFHPNTQEPAPEAWPFEPN